MFDVFNNENFGSVRTVKNGNDIWFVGKDVVEALKYERTSYSDTIKRYCDADDYILINKNSITDWGYSNSNNPNVGLFDYRELGRKGGYLINEYALYDLVLQSPLPQAKQFKRWITHEVIPQIRSTGGYIPVTKEESDEDILAKALLIAQKTIDKKNDIIQAQQEIIEDTKEELTYTRMELDDTRIVANLADQLLSIEGAYSGLAVCKALGINMGRTNFYKWLRANNIFTRSNLPTATYSDNGYFKVVAKKDHSGKMRWVTLFRGKAISMVYRKLAKQGHTINKSLEEIKKDLEIE